MFCGFVYFRGWTISPKVRNPGFFIYLAWRKRGNNEENTHLGFEATGKRWWFGHWCPLQPGSWMEPRWFWCVRSEFVVGLRWRPRTRSAHSPWHRGIHRRERPMKNHIKRKTDTKSALQSCQRQRSWNAFHCFVETIFKRNNFHFQFHQSSIWGQCESLWCPGCSDVCWQQSIFHHLLVTTIWLLYDYYMSLSFEFDSCIEVEERLCGWNLQAFTFAYLHRIDANRDVCVWISESYRHSGRWIYTTREKQQHRQRRRFGEGSIFKYKKEAGTWQPKRCSIHNTFEGLGRFGESATAVLFKRFLKVRYLTCLVDVICFLVVSRLRHLDISIYIYTLTI